MRHGDSACGSLRAALPPAIQARIVSLAASDPGDFTAALAHGDVGSIASVSRELAGRAGPIVTLQGAVPHLEPARCYDIARLMLERSISINTAAAGGNASLMMLPIEGTLRRCPR